MTEAKYLMRFSVKKTFTLFILTFHYPRRLHLLTAHRGCINLN
jgi:hypothetical protein